MSSSYMCPNCGIKVSASEEAGCPGCGHKQSESQESSQSVAIDSSAIFAESPLKANLFGEKKDELAFAIEFFRENVDNREAEYLKNPKGFLFESEARCLAAIEQAPNDESKNAIYSYLSSLYVQMGRHQSALEVGLYAVNCKEDFFKNQGYDSIFYAFAELQLNDQFKEWLETARKNNYPSMTYHEIQYFVNMGQLKEALEKCDEYAISHPEWGVQTRASVYQELGHPDEAEALYRKVTSRRATTPFYANSANSLAFSILMPQKRFVEAETVLVQALATRDVRERVNAYSNLAMVAFNLKEYSAAKRYAEVGANSHDQAIASESLLTLCRIEYQRLIESEGAAQSDWDNLLTLVKKNLGISDFDDAAEFFKILIAAVEKSSKGSELVSIIEDQYDSFTSNIEWPHSTTVRLGIEKARVDKLSELFLQEQRYPEIEELFLSVLDFLKNQENPTLIEYLKIPFAAVSFREKCLQITDVDFLTEWALFETHAEILHRIAENKVERILLSVAANPATTDETLKVILAEKDLDLDFAISIRGSLSQDLVKLLITSPFDAVRREMAQRADLEYKDFELLATDISLLVRDTLKDNPACPTEIKALAALGSL